MWSRQPGFDFAVIRRDAYPETRVIERPVSFFRQARARAYAAAM